MHTKIFSATTIGVNTHTVEVEVDLSYGLLQFFIVGLPDAAIKESRQRVQTALKNCAIKLPERKITVNLAPADLKKEGTTFDLAIAIGIVHAAGIVIIDSLFLQETFFLGELSLDGTIKPVKGALPIAYDAPALGKKRVIVPLHNAQEAALPGQVEVIGVQTLQELLSYLRKDIALAPTQSTHPHSVLNKKEYIKNFQQVKGQTVAKRALQIAAAGRHNILFIGSPGSGKTMLAERLSSIMPPMTFDEILQTSKVYSISGKLERKPLIIERPFRNPHHTISQAGLVGGGTYPQPGEISLAHNGILFLDELTEFKREVLEVLRQPLEEHTVCIARAQHTISFPASFMLVAALNPCPCGFLGDKRKHCICTPQQVKRYIAKISGPLLDRIDLQVPVPSVDYDTIVNTTVPQTSSEELYMYVEQAVEIQRTRNNGSWNAHLNPQMIELHCALSGTCTSLVKKAFDKLYLTMRGYHKLLRIARTIADLEKSENIQEHHLKEALLYRSLDHTLEKEYMI